MQLSVDRILTTHTGSLPRPDLLGEAMVLRDRGKLPSNQMNVIPQRIRGAVTAIVQRQVDTGVDIVNDGEMSKIGYATYVRERLTGFDGEAGRGFTIGDLSDLQEFAQRSLAGLDPATPTCRSSVKFIGAAAVAEDIANLKAATAKTDTVEVFMTAASPGVISIYLQNEYYPNEEAYLAAIGSAMREEYEAICDAGFVLQIDAPDLAMGRHVGAGVLTVEEFRRKIALRVELLNDATRNIPQERLRIHVCWGNYMGPHHLDVPLRDIVDIIFRSRAGAILFEAANPRHEHEWRVFEQTKVPDDKILIPGVIDTCTNYVEHPELIADRIVRFAQLVGRDRIIAGTDCGFASFASFLSVDPKIAWMKLHALVDGAAEASRRLW